MPFSMTKFAKIRSARNGAFERSIVSFHATDEGTRTNRENLVFCFLQSALLCCSFKRWVITK